MENGWIKLHRKLLDNPISKRPKWFSVWIHLLLLANHNEHSFIWNGKRQVIRDGQLLTGRKELAKICGVTHSLLERVLNYLEIEHQIEQQKTTKYRVITILNWSKYQKENSKSDNKRTTDGQQTDTYKNDKNEENDKKGENTPASIATSFFKGEEWYGKLLDSFAEGNDRSVIEPELKKFILYWTEPNKSGTRVRWEQQNTFEVKRRLFTWLSRVKNFNVSKGRGLET